jgi:O-antigen/teichoic acid export membrane protein
MGGRIGRHAAIYGSGSLLTLAFGFVNVAVLTRFLDTGEYGELAVCLVYAALLTVLYNAGSLQGSFSWVFGSTGEEELEAGRAPTGARDKRRALGSALTLTAVIAALGTALNINLADEISDLVLGVEDHAAILWAAISGGLGSLWRLASNVLRLERRPAAYVWLAATRPVLVLAVSIPLVATGGGVAGAMAGVAIATAGSLLVTLVAVRRSFRFAFTREDAANIFRLGGPWVPTVVALWVMHQADVFLLSQFASDSDVGVYRVAARVGAVMSYLVSAFLMAWGPLSADPIAAAVEREQGKRQAGATLTTYFALASLAGILGLAVFSHVLVRIAPPAYEDAAPLIPLIGLGFVCYGAFVVVYRTAGIPNGRRVYIGTTIFSAAILILSAVVLIPPWGPYGAAAAVCLGPAAGMAALFVVARRRDHPPPLQAARIAGGFGLAIACFLMAKAGTLLGPPFGPALEVLAWIAYPVLLVLTGVIPRDHLPRLAAIARSAMLGGGPETAIAREVDSLDDDEREPLDLVLRGDSPDDAARALGKSEPELLEDLVHALRKVGGVGEPCPADARIGAYLVSTAGGAERDAMARALWTSDVDPLELDSLTVILRALTREHRRSERRRWRPQRVG